MKLPSTITLDAEQVARLRRLLGEMPYGGTSFRVGGRFTTADDLISDLDRLRITLGDTGEREMAMSAELNTLRAQRAAMRAFLGTDTSLADAKAVKA